MTRVPFDIDQIRMLATILEERCLTEIELRDGDSHLRLQRTPVLQASPPPAQPLPPPGNAPDPVAHEPPPPEGTVPSPMVGIAYLAPEPGAAPFVTLGQAVTPGQTLMLIEAMKTFNQVKAPHAGTVTHILVTAGQPVEYGQPLVVIA